MIGKAGFTGRTKVLNTAGGYRLPLQNAVTTKLTTMGAQGVIWLALLNGRLGLRLVAVHKNAIGKLSEFIVTQALVKFLSAAQLLLKLLVFCLKIQQRSVERENFLLKRYQRRQDV